MLWKPHTPNVIVFATAGKGPNEGGSGLVQLAEQSRCANPPLRANIVAVVSQYENGGAYTKAHLLGIPFELMQAPFTAEKYQAIFKKYHADYAMLSGWVQYVRGLETSKVINIHPAPPENFGGEGWYGLKVHQEIIKAFQAGQITETAVCMHFVDPFLPYDKGPKFFHFPVMIRDDDDAKSLQKRVGSFEHAWQSYMLNLVVHGVIILEQTNERYYIVCKYPDIKEIIPGMKEACSKSWPKGKEKKGG